MVIRTCAVSFLVLALACGSSGSKKDTAKTGEVPQAEQKTLAEVGLDPAALDKSADPCNDFYQYACGGWLSTHEIPADKSAYGRFYEIQERNEKALKEILDRSASGDDKTSPAMARVKDYYGACMDEPSVEKSGLPTIAPLLKSIKSVKNRKSLQATITKLHQNRIWALWSMEAEADFKDATMNILFVDQSGLGLPDRDYYLKDDENMKKLRVQYTEHLDRMFKLAGYSARNSQMAATAVMKLETRLAKASKTAVERRDPKGLYNKVDRAGLSKLVGNFNWSSYFKALGSADLDGISVTAPKFFERVNIELESTSMKDWRYYLTWRVLQSTSHLLGKKFDDEAFTFTTALTGQKERRPRWKRCLGATNAAIGELLAQPYIDKMFPGNSKTAAENMVKSISEAFKVGVAKLDWMSGPTKAKAEEKRRAMAHLIGYPSKWKTYDFEIVPDNYASNTLQARAWELRRQLLKVGKSYDREEWFMVPQTVNAYYHPLANQMVFPAGILQTPFFDANASAAVNLGSMGMIVGHELTHGFDDSGAQFGADGNMNNWWQKQDLDKFKGKGECVIAQYESYQPLSDAKINGKLTLGENIADIGGVKFAYNAYKKLRSGAKPIVADGYTEDQQFFLAVGQAWCSKYREKTLRQRLNTDPHSPPKFRVNGAVTNQPEFAQAFSCEEGTAMAPADRCEVW